MCNEENKIISTILFQDVMESLDADSIYQVAMDCYNKAQVITNQIKF